MNTKSLTGTNEWLTFALDSLSSFEQGTSSVDTQLALSLIQAELGWLIGSRGHDPGHLHTAISCIRELRECSLSGKMDRKVALRLEWVLRGSELKLLAHEALPDVDAAQWLDEFHAFRRDHGTILFGSLIEWAQTKVENDLYLTQNLYFNAMVFDKAHVALEEDHAMYEEIARVVKNRDLDNEVTKDCLLARLEGTFGQASAFLAALSTGDVREQLSRSAETYLLKDVEYLRRGEDDWVQAVNYLCTLYWQRSELGLALRWLSESLVAPEPLSLAQLGCITGPDALVSSQHEQRWWIVLNQLRLCALALEQGALVPGDLRLAGVLESCLERGDAYPLNLVLKWAILLAASSGILTQQHLARARALFSVPRRAPILELMRAVELSLVASVTQHDIDRVACLEQATAIAGKLAMRHGFGEFLSRCKWNQELQAGSMGTIRPYEISCALPFYYA